MLTQEFTTQELQSELWKPVLGYEGLYKVSSLGRVWSVKRDKFLKIHLNAYGYPHVGLHIAGAIRTWTVHRLVALAFLPPVDGKLHVNHKDFDKMNARPQNLEWCTSGENSRHAAQTRATRGIRVKRPNQLIAVRGTRNGRAKLTEVDVRQIKSLLSQGISCAAIGIQFNVDRRTIYSIDTGVNWKHI